MKKSFTLLLLGLCFLLSIPSLQAQKMPQYMGSVSVKYTLGQKDNQTFGLALLGYNARYNFMKISKKANLSVSAQPGLGLSAHADNIYGSSYQFGFDFPVIVDLNFGAFAYKPKASRSSKGGLRSRGSGSSRSKNQNFSAGGYVGAGLSYTYVSSSWDEPISIPGLITNVGMRFNSSIPYLGKSSVGAFFVLGFNNSWMAGFKYEGFFH
jgi:hypothetical protein